MYPAGRLVQGGDPSGGPVDRDPEIPVLFLKVSDHRFGLTLFLHCKCGFEGEVAKFVQFGIDQNGYFYADIPENWDFLRFETGYDTSNPDEYLHLIINY